MQVWHLVFRPDSLTYTISRALAEFGLPVSIWVVDREHEARAPSRIERRVLESANVSIVRGEPSRLPMKIDRLIFQAFPRPHEAVRDLPHLASLARAITVISAGDRSRRWAQSARLQWMELRHLGLAAARVDRVLYKDGCHAIDVFGLIGRRGAVGFDVHSQFLSDADCFAAMHAADWDCEMTRPYLINFMGSQDPPSRLTVLDGIRHLVDPAAAASTGARKPMLWCEYSDAVPGGMPPLEFVAALTNSDFTLCPRGYSNITHRPIEAVVRGSIPILDAGDLDLYGIDLVPGMNCVAVRRGEWANAVRAVMRMSEGEVQDMRREVTRLRGAVSYRAVASGICRRLGL